MSGGAADAILEGRSQSLQEITGEELLRLKSKRLSKLSL